MCPTEEGVKSVFYSRTCKECVLWKHKSRVCHLTLKSVCVLQKYKYIVCPTEVHVNSVCYRSKCKVKGCVL